MDRAEARRSIDLIRSMIHKRYRDVLHGSVYYKCKACSARVKIGMAEGVSPARSGWMRPQTYIDCVMDDCDGIMVRQNDTYDPSVVGCSAYLRVPSRRSANRMVERGGDVEPQVVIL